MNDKALELYEVCGVADVNMNKAKTKQAQLKHALALEQASREQGQRERALLVNAIVATLREHKHLADGENCTLKKLTEALRDMGLACKRCSGRGSYSKSDDRYSYFTVQCDSCMGDGIAR